jgi:hypothetical protein
VGRDWRTQLDQLVTGDGRTLGPYLKAEIIREFARLHLVMDQISRDGSDQGAGGRTAGRTN